MMLLSEMAANRMRQAATNLDRALATTRRFTENPFRGRWDAFLFFDPNSLFASDFVERINVLLACEDSALMCMRNLDIACNSGSNEQASIFLARETLGESYLAQLGETGAGAGWLYRMDRYGCTSDVGDWCVYCERNNEIAVIAVRGDNAAVKFEPALEQLAALPITEAIEKPSSYGLSSAALPALWRNQMLREFAPKRRPLSWLL